MRRMLLTTLLLGGCVVGSDSDSGPGPDPDPDPDPEPRVCTLPEAGADAGDLVALKAEQCNVSGSMGQLKYYRLSATLAGTTHVVQLELWDGRGAFLGGAVAPGTYEISGPELSYETCGVCLRGLGDKGGANEQEFFATGGTVEVTAVGPDGAPISATITNATFDEVDPATKAPVAEGCTASIARLKVDGVVVDKTGDGGGGGGDGGGGGGGGGGCATGIGD